MNATLDKKSTWWSEPMVWLLIALPVTAVVASGITMWLAANGADPLVNEDYVKEGLAVRQVLDRDHKAAELGLTAAIEAVPGRLTVRLAGQLDSQPGSLTLTLSHPTDSARDMVLQLNPAGGGLYTTEFASLPEGRRELELTPANKIWRLSGQWPNTHSGPISLTPQTGLVAKTPSSTQP